MSAVPAPRQNTWRDSETVAGDRPSLKLRRCRLDYDAALREHLRGGCAARVAAAAGSQARSRRNLRRVGLKIVARLKSRCDVRATFDRLGFTLEDFCRSVIERCQATKTKRYFYRGRLVGVYRDPDWAARKAAIQRYLESTGILDLPP